MEFLQSYNFTIKHKSGVQNVVADALSRKHSLLSAMEVKVVGFETFKDLYENDVDFGSIWQNYKSGSCQQFSIFDGFLFRANALCVPTCSLRQVILAEAHGGVLGGHFGRDKTLALA